MAPNNTFPPELSVDNVSSSNNHSLDKDYISISMELHDVALALCVLKTIAIVAGAAGNLCVLRFLKQERKKLTRRRATNLNVFIHSLAISDVLIILNIPFIWIIFMGQIYAGWLCKARRFVAVVFPLITIYNLVVIGIERYILICRPTSRPLSRATVQKALKGAWVMGFFVSLLNVYSIDSFRVDLNGTHYTTRCKVDNSNIINVAMFQIFIVIGYVIPFVSICFTCVSVIRKVWKKKFHVSVAEKDVSTALRKWRRKQRKATMFLLIIIIAFLTPYFMYLVYSVVAVVLKSPITDFASDFVKRNTAIILAYFNSFVNFCMHLVQLPGFGVYFKSRVCRIKPNTNVERRNNEAGIQRRMMEQSPASGIIGMGITQINASENIHSIYINPASGSPKTLGCQRRHSIQP